MASSIDEFAKQFFQDILAEADARGHFTEDIFLKNSANI